MAGDLAQFRKISDAIGAVPALQLCAFASAAARHFRVPSDPSQPHPTKRLIGDEAWAKLCETYGGTTLPIPALQLVPLRRAGLVAALARRGVPVSVQAAACGCSTGRISQLRDELELEGISASILDPED
jgi:hypothetical protein